MTTREIPCGCRSPQQDEMYGSGVRLHNLARGKSQSDTDNWRCTVCGDKKFNVAKPKERRKSK